MQSNINRNDCYIKVNDIFDELNAENKRLNDELMFANNCLKSLNKFKLLLDKIYVKYETTIDSDDKRVLNSLKEEFNGIVETNKKTSLSTERVVQQNIKKFHRLTDPNTEMVSEDMDDQRKEVLNICYNSDELKFWSNGRTNCKTYSKLKTCVNSESNPELYQKPVPQVMSGPDFDPNSMVLLQRNNLDPTTNLYVCPNPDCHKSYSSRKSLKSHFRVNHYQNKRLICDRLNCNKMFRTVRHLKNHFITHLNIKPYHCTIDGCHYRCKLPEQLRQHSYVHSDVKRFECSECHKKFRFKSTLSEHLLVHNKAGQPLHWCTVVGCDQSFKTRYWLKKHKEVEHNIVTNLKLCEWPGCDYKTNKSDLYAKHFRNHTGEKPYLCQWPGCDRKFKNKQNLNDHLLVHKDLKPVACVWPGCQYRCRISSNMIKHVRIHRK